jgi:hypothetical protein
MEGQQPAYSQLEVTPITLLNSPPVYQRGSLIAVNHNYICYVVKGNLRTASLFLSLIVLCMLLLLAWPDTHAAVVLTFASCLQAT